MSYEDYTDYGNYAADAASNYGGGYGAPSGGGSFLGGLGGLGGISSGLSNFAMNPLTQMSLKMLGNLSPQINKIPNMFEGVGDTALKAGTLQQRQAETEASKKALMTALIGAGIDPAQAAVLANNPGAAQIAIAQAKDARDRGRSDAWAAGNAPAEAPPYTPSQDNGEAPDGAPPDKQSSAGAPQYAAADNTDFSSQNKQPNKTADAQEVWRKALDQLQSKDLAANNALAVSPRDNLIEKPNNAPAYAARAVAGRPPEQDQAQADEPINPETDIEAIRAKMAADKAAGKPDTSPGGLDLSWLKLPPEKQAGGQPQAGQPAQTGQQPAQSAIQYGTPQAQAQPTPQVGAPQGSMQPMAQGPPAGQTGPPPQNATERAQAIRDQAKQQQNEARIAQINRQLYLAPKDASPAAVHALQLELQDRYKQRQTESKWQWGKIGSSLEGDQMGWINTSTQQLKDQYGRPVTAESGATSGALAPLYTKIGELRDQGVAPNKILDEVLPPSSSAKEYVKAVLRGDALPGNMGRVSGETRSQYMRLAHAVDPNFNEAQIPLRQTFARNMAGSSPNSWGSQVRSAGTITKHLAAGLDNLDVVEKGAQGVPGGEYGESPPLNYARSIANANALDKQYNKAKEAYSVDADAVAGEVVRLLTGGQGSEKDRKEWRDKFDYTKKSISGVRGAWNEAYTIMYGRLEKIAEQKDNAFGTQTDPLSLLGEGGSELQTRIRQQGAAPGTQGAPRITRDDAGRAAYERMPKGTKYTDPDGNLKTKQ